MNREKDKNSKLEEILEKDIKEEKEQPKEKKEQPKEDKDNRSLGEKIEDKIDDIVATTQDILYGERKNINEDIPATMPDPDNEIRHVNKIQTRKNISKKIMKNGGWKILTGVLVFGLLMTLVITLIEKMLLA